MDDENLDPEREEEESPSPAADGDQKSAISADLIRGHINTIILRTLYERDKYGYEIIEEIEAKSHGQYTLKQPTLYSALKRLESQGYINAYWKTDEVSQGGRRKYYTLTDSGREVTERNQAEWEYSRTVIDNLISDKNFDFTQPPPAPSVDFKILKDSTTRVRTQKEDEREVTYEEPDDEQVVEVVHDNATEVVVTEAEKPEEPPAVEETAEDDVDEQLMARLNESVEEPEEPQAPAEMTDEERRAVHENYLRLISDTAAEPEPEPVTPYAENINTDNLIYNNKPDAERDYRNLINNLFSNTYTAAPAREAAEQPAPAASAPAATTATPAPAKVRTEHIRVEDASSTSAPQEISVDSSEYVVGKRRKYTRGSAMFICSLIVAAIMLFEFAMCLIFKKQLGITLAYPFVIFAIACAQTLIFFILRYTDFGKSTRKPTTLLYLSACIITCILIILIIFVTAILLEVNFASAGDIMAKIIIPCFVALNIPIFGVVFYLLSK